MVRFCILLVGLVLASGASAHTKLASSEPPAAASVSGPLGEIVLVFEGEVRLTVVALTDAGGAEKKVAEVPSDVAERFAIAVEEPLAPGEYVIRWRAVGADTHVVSGEIPFTVLPAAARL
jgi:methionine-rich copper-binding protein CopC